MKNGCETIDTKMTPDLAAGNLEDYFIRQKQIIVAYSGGVDSALLAFAAHRALGDQMVASLLAGVSGRRYHQILEPVGDAVTEAASGTSQSSVSPGFRS